MLTAHEHGSWVNVLWNTIYSGDPLLLCTFVLGEAVPADESSKITFASLFLGAATNAAVRHWIKL